MELVLFNHPVLQERGEGVDSFDDELEELCGCLLEVLHDAEGIGMAGHHAGVSKQICVIDFPKDHCGSDMCECDDSPCGVGRLMPLFLINPEIIFYSESVKTEDEGSISFPGIRGPIERSEEIVLTYQDLRGDMHRLKCSGLLARCIQHEVDQANGMIYIKRMAPSAIKRLEVGLKKLKCSTKKKR